MSVLAQEESSSTKTASKSKASSTKRSRWAGEEARINRTLEFKAITPEQIRASITGNDANPVLAAAYDYLGRGWSVIPVSRRKKAACNWTEFQDKRATIRDVDVWFRHSDQLGVAIALGPVSGDLYVRDFDKEISKGAYAAWSAAYPELAEILPTARTPNGYHVYFRWLEPLRTKTFDDGELRGEGGYVVAPPSQNAEGVEYEWINELGDKIPIIDPFVAGFLPRVARRTFTDRDSNKGITLSVKHKETLSVKHRSIARDVEERILRVLPTEHGQRHWCVFGLDRGLKAIPSLVDASFEELEPIFNIWFELALPFIRTKERQESWSDFVDGWDRVRWPAGMDFLEVMFKRAKDAHTPGCSARLKRKSPALLLLVRLCRELQCFHGDKPFYLSCRDAARLLWPATWEIDNLHVKANQWMNRLVKYEILEITERPPRKSGRAYRFRYLGDIQPTETVATRVAA